MKLKTGYRFFGYSFFTGFVQGAKNLVRNINVPIRARSELNGPGPRSLRSLCKGIWRGFNFFFCGNLVFSLGKKKRRMKTEWGKLVKSKYPRVAVLAYKALCRVSTSGRELVGVSYKDLCGLVVLPSCRFCFKKKPMTFRYISVPA